MPRFWSIIICSLGLLAACDAGGPKFKSTDITGVDYGSTLALTDHHGKARRLEEFRGKAVVLFFGFANCPDVCPTTLADIAVALRTLDAATAKQVQVVFVTTDPKRDTPQVLRQWLDRFDADLPVQFVGLTGSQQDLDQAQLAAGVPVAEDDGQTHSALLLLYGHDDKAHVAFDAGNSGRDIAHDLRIVAGAS